MQLTNKKTPRVILVHGTFASDSKDYGLKWWQRGSDFWNELEHDLQNQATNVGDRELFRWEDDQNSEVSRRLAAVRLLRYLKPFEHSGTPYHLVGHSHGGSVIWEALKLSFGRRSRYALRYISSTAPPLKNLQSWTTIGTPFLHKKSRFLRWAISGAFTIIVLLGFATWVSMIAVVGLIVPADEPYSVNIALFTKFFLGVWFLYVVLAGFVTTYDDGRSLRREIALKDVVLRAYGDKWFGIWSAHDEVINSLKLAAQFEAKFITNKPFRRSPFVGPLWWIMVWPAARITQYAKKIVGPTIDRIISRSISRKALGDDRPAPKSIEVSATPFSLVADDLALGDAASNRLQCASNTALADSMPQLRSLLRGLAANPGCSLEEVASQLNVPETFLIHTSYFREPEVRRLIVAHIALSQSSHVLVSTLSQHTIDTVCVLKDRVEELQRRYVVRHPNMLVRTLLAIPPWILIILGLFLGSWLAVLSIRAFNALGMGVF